MVVAQHAVAKVSGTVDGFTLVTGVLAPQDHPTLALANCALHILRVARQVKSELISHFASRPGSTEQGLQGYALARVIVFLQSHDGRAKVAFSAIM